MMENLKEALGSLRTALASAPVYTAMPIMYFVFLRRAPASSSCLMPSVSVSPTPWNVVS